MNTWNTFIAHAHLTHNVTLIFPKKKSISKIYWLAPTYIDSVISTPNKKKRRQNQIWCYFFHSKIFPSHKSVLCCDEFTHWTIDSLSLWSGYVLGIIDFDWSIMIIMTGSFHDRMKMIYMNAHWIMWVFKHSLARTHTHARSLTTSYRVMLRNVFVSFNV